jgi:hypothetical protein
MSVPALATDGRLAEWLGFQALGHAGYKGDHVAILLRPRAAR